MSATNIVTLIQRSFDIPLSYLIFKIKQELLSVTQYFFSITQQFFAVTQQFFSITQGILAVTQFFGKFPRSYLRKKW